MSWGIAETAPEIEKIKSESADYLNGLNSCGVIDWNTYNRAFDFYADLLKRAYEQGRKDTQPEILYCKKCKHWTQTCGDEQWGLGDCDVFDKHLVMCNGYCAWAERREE